jgi:outer membrane protein assembly factor BamB
VIVNSNGDRRVGPADAADGLYFLDAATGRVVRHVVPDGSGEKDTNGVAFTDDAIYFGTDQEHIFKYDWDGRLLADRAVDGDVEAAPALGDVDGDGALDVVFGTEAGTLYVFDAALQRIVFSHADTIGDYDQRGFMGAAALFDTDGDGAAEIFVPGRGQTFWALDVKRRRPRWRQASEAGLHGSPIVVDVDDDGVSEVAFADSYGVVYLANAADGALRWKVEPAGQNDMLWIFAPIAWYPDAGCIVVAGAPPWTSGEGEKLYCINARTGEVRWSYRSRQMNLSSGSVVGAGADGQIHQGHGLGS